MQILRLYPVEHYLLQTRLYIIMKKILSHHFKPLLVKPINFWFLFLERAFSNQAYFILVVRSGAHHLQHEDP